MGEIRTAGKLLDNQGNLLVTGWAKQPLVDANLEDLKFYSLKLFQPLRVKRWQYYGITTPTNFFSFTISNVGYLASIFAYMLDFNTNEFHEDTLSIPFGRGVILARNSTAGDCYYKKDDLHLHFSVKSDNLRILDIYWPDFCSTFLKADLNIRLEPGHESMVNIFPYQNKRFFYTRKINCMPVKGIVEYGVNTGKLENSPSSKTYNLDPQNSLAVLDWGVGVWPYRSFWIWASFSHYLEDGRTIGLNLGGGIGNNPEITDNAVILNGKISKFGNIEFKYDNRDFKKPWHLRSDDGKLDLEFIPFFERVAKTDIVFLASEVHQIFGRYYGIIIMGDGEKISIDGLIGWAEEHRARW